MAYLDLAGFRGLTTLRAAVVTRVEAEHAGWIDEQLGAVSDEIDAQLAKRYEAPFAAPYPRIVKLWLAQIVAAAVLDKHGAEALEAQATRFYEAEARARTQIQAAADAEKGLYQLPLRGDTNKSGVKRGGPRSYTEASPFVHRERQRDRGRLEDFRRDGTRRG